ncbi:hypothetical protein MYSTI_05430 [Myxococcus stipitatus DSM 14675]|uniref:NACHT domain-containing protein n=1 Tax=Myxococcus stipitatus (strain DSM 14675 / JCM 12634 / Mx s8) TaxID=1278073 RepID=L7UJT4_MYXSD|nr:pentapeptide repeat-containing protein [Myxococcus stipitatus]AGC46709.1 hypothetical protein MYSTI_05430 [Myxococcus stipitatus DSM 14675]
MSRGRIDVLIVTALKDELDAVLGLELDGRSRDAWMPLRDRDGVAYLVREVQNELGETLQIAAAWSVDMGVTAAAHRATRLIAELEPSCLAMCGICAGWRGKVSLGDVIVADRVFTYDTGKQVARDETGGGGFFHDITTYNLQTAWKVDASDFANEFARDWLYARERPISRQAQARWLLLALDAHEQRIEASPLSTHPERKERCPDWATLIPQLRKEGLLESGVGVLRLTAQGRAWVTEARLLDPEGEARDPAFQVHVAPIATGSAVQEDPGLFQRLARHSRKVLAAEMESSAISFVAERSGVRSIIVKAVSDHADFDKDDAFRKFACRASAEFLLLFLRRYVRALEPGIRPPRADTAGDIEEAEDENGPPLVHSQPLRDDFLGRIERACQLREPPGTQVIRLRGVPPFATYLEVSVLEGGFLRCYPLGALDQPLTREAIEMFYSGVAARYRWENPAVIPRLVHAGPTAADELASLAHERRIDLQSFTQYQGLLDFDRYLQRQTARLEKDPVYLPMHYVEPRGQVSIGGQRSIATADVLRSVRDLLATPDRRFALVLGDFGTGKTYLLHELARRMGQEPVPALVPVLIEMRSLQKQRTLRELVAQHFAPGDVQRFEVEKFLYMLHEGRIALLFDGFDELALRVTYDRALEHFGTLIEAVRGKAKVVVTSRTQHFLTDLDVKRELARRAEAIPGHHLLKLERFSEDQIHQFLVKRLGSEAAADERMGLLRDVRDLLGLSENPRLLSFIVELDGKQLRAARGGSGEITSAKLYALLIERWLKGEHERVNPPGAPKGLSLAGLRRGATALALLLWERTERTVSLSELPKELLNVVNTQGEQALDLEGIRHQLGSGSLLVRGEEDRFAFVHQSVMEWLVAEVAVEELNGTGEVTVLGRRELTDLMADFFISLATPSAARSWAERTSSMEGSEIAKRNALHVLSRLRGRGERTSHETTKNLAGSDLRNQDLTKANLRRADLRKVNLTAVPLIEADLRDAQLQSAALAHANLEGANMQSADLRDADLTGARLVAADMSGAKLQGAKLRRAILLGAQVDSLEHVDVTGAALPDISPSPQLAAYSPCKAVAISPTDTLLATGHVDGTVRIWDTRESSMLRVLRGPRGAIVRLAFSPDGTTLASASDAGEIDLWNLSTGSSRRVLSAASSGEQLTFDTKGVILAASFKRGLVKFWSVEEMRELRAIHRQRDDTVWNLSFSPDGAMLALATTPGGVEIWSVDHGTRLHVMTGGPGDEAAIAVAFSPDGISLSAATRSGKLLRWEPGDHTKVVWQSVMSTAIKRVFNQSGTHLAALGMDHSLRVWNVSNKSLVRVINGNGTLVQDIALSPNGDTLAAAYVDGSLSFWSLPGGQCHVLQGQGKTSSVRAIVFNGDETIVQASSDGALASWNIAAGQLIGEHTSPSDLDSRALLSPNGQWLASIESGVGVHIWNATNGTHVRTLPLAPGTSPIRALAFHPREPTIASTVGRKSLQFWDIPTGKSSDLFNHPWAAVRTLVFTPDGDSIVSTGNDNKIRLLNWRKEEVGQTSEALGDSISSVALSPDGQLLAASTASQPIRIRSVQDWCIRSGLGRTTRGARKIVFSMDGEMLAVLEHLGSVTIWSVVLGKLLCILDGHPVCATDLAFSPDSTRIAVGYSDGVVGIHDARQGTCLAKLLRTQSGAIALRQDRRYRAEHFTSAMFWFVSGLCRFETNDIVPLLPSSLQLTKEEPFLTR